MDTAGIQAVFDRLGRDVWLVTAASGDRRGGLIATFVIPASIVPALPRVLLGVAQQHHTWELIEASSAFALHLLGEEHLDLVWRFGLRSGRAVDKLAGLEWRLTATGSPCLAGTRGCLDCRVEARLDTGDRTIYLAEVLDGQLTTSGPPLTLQRLLHLAPPEKLRELKEGMLRDVTVDAAAIQSWRQENPKRAAH